MYNGVINVYKTTGLTSHDVVNRLRRILGQKKIGHTGTLDPAASGVLPVALGSATKLCEMFTAFEKEYETVMRLGITTDTQDMTGQVLEKRPVQVTSSDLTDLFPSFTGKIWQTPPMYSAVKFQGHKLYELARKGIEVERKARQITIHEITLLSFADEKARLLVRCSKGTYIRTLCADMGEALGCGACVETLERTGCGGFRVETSLRLDEIEKLHQKGELTGHMVFPDELFEQAGKAGVKEELDYRLHNGNSFVREELLFSPDTKEGANTLRLYDSTGAFIGLYGWDRKREHYHPLKMFLPL